MLSQKEKLLLRLAEYFVANRGERKKASEIAKALGIAPRYAEATLQSLVTRGLVDGKKGPQGGYVLVEGLLPSIADWLGLSFIDFTDSNLIVGIRKSLATTRIDGGKL